VRRRIFLKTCAAATLTSASGFAVAAEASPRYYSRARLEWEGGKPVKSAALQAEVNYIFNYPYAATPCFLLNLGRRLVSGATLRTADAHTYRWPGGIGPGQSIVAYSAICAHKMSYPARQISFISYRKQATQTGKRSSVIHCCSEHSEYDPARGAAVIGGPAPQPLAVILLDYDAKADELYAVGTLGGEMFDKFFSKFEFRLSLDFRGKAHQPAGTGCRVFELSKYSRQQMQC
jgi:arsenite oxidase small subunit